MKKIISTLTKSSVAIFILSFLNINFETSNDTETAVWAYLYLPFDGERIEITIAGYLGIISLLYSIFFKSNLSSFFFFIGLFLLWIAVASFYPLYSRMQRDTFINPQSLFILFTIILLATNWMAKTKRQLTAKPS